MRADCRRPPAAVVVQQNVGRVGSGGRCRVAACQRRVNDRNDDVVAGEGARMDDDEYVMDMMDGEVTMEGARG